jgi:hypothetical protein
MKELVFMWFTGQGGNHKCSSEEDSFIDKFCEIVSKKQNFTKFSVKCHAPPMSDDGTRKWATYKNEDGSKEKTTDNTCNVDNVEKELNVTAKHLYGLVEDEKTYIFGGTSNGCIPAYEFARHYSIKKKVLGCILHNGCPAMNNTEFGTRRKIDRFPTLMILGTLDPWWDNHRNSYHAAYVLGAAILPFKGKHIEMPSVDACVKSFLAVLMTHQEAHDGAGVRDGTKATNVKLGAPTNTQSPKRRRKSSS